jgi:hypothetical protein
VTDSPLEARPARSRTILVVTLFVAWTVAAGFALRGAFGLGLRTWAAFDGLLPGCRGPLVWTWETALLAALLVALLLGGRIAARVARAGGSSRRRVRWTFALCALVAVVGFGGWTGWLQAHGRAELGANRWGFAQSFPPGQTTRFDPHNGEVPYVVMQTNRFGYRDGDWPLAPPGEGEARALLVGDSTMLGLSIQEGHDLLDAVLERELGARTGLRWDVWNLGAAPASLRYFVEVLLRVLPDSGARVAVLFLHVDHDVVRIDEQLALADKPAWFHVLRHSVGLSNALLQVSSNPGPFTCVYGRDDALVATMQADLERLLTWTGAHDVHVVVFSPWDARGAGDQQLAGFFAPFEGRPGFTLLGERDLPRVCGAGADPCRLYDDASLGFPFTGHLTPRGMRVVGQAIADAIVAAAGR